MSYWGSETVRHLPQNQSQDQGRLNEVPREQNLRGTHSQGQPKFKSCKNRQPCSASHHWRMGRLERLPTDFPLLLVDNYPLPQGADDSALLG